MLLYQALRQQRPRPHLLHQTLSASFNPTATLLVARGSYPRCCRSPEVLLASAGCARSLQTTASTQSLAKRLKSLFKQPTNQNSSAFSKKKARISPKKGTPAHSTAKRADQPSLKSSANAHSASTNPADASNGATGFQSLSSSGATQADTPKLEQKKSRAQRRRERKVAEEPSARADRSFVGPAKLPWDGASSRMRQPRDAESQSTPHSSSEASEAVEDASKRRDVPPHLNADSPQGEAVSGWGPDRLAPSAPSASDAWRSTPAWGAATQAAQQQLSRNQHTSTPPSGHASRTSDSGRSPPRTHGLLTGDEAIEASLLKLRDAQGRLVSTASFGGPVADERRKWTETISGSLNGKDAIMQPVEPLRKMDVPALAHGLDRVLFNPGIYWMRDPRSGIYNFDPRIRDVLDVDLFDYEALTPYVTSSKDPELATLTKRHHSKFCGSTSSMTGLLSQCYFHVSGLRHPDTSGFSAPFSQMPGGFSFGAKLPASIVLNWLPYNDGSGGGHYAIDADKESAGEAANNNYVLTSLGKSMEKMLTSTPEEYARYMRINSADLKPEDRNKPESYHYAQAGKLMMRSQLDCSDDRLPRRTFDLKTRASIGIRTDRANYVEGSGYQIRKAQGLVESFEREYYDMIRAAFLKYNFQARIGHMDGIFVAYHTTSTIYGFQYISVEEMNERLFGGDDMADQSFSLSLGMLENILEAATNLFPSQTLKLTFETKDRADLPMSVFVETTEKAEKSEQSSDVSTNTQEQLADARDQPQDEEASSAPESRKRSIAQLDVTVDRYLDHQLVSGPVEFSLLPGRMIDPLKEDEIERRHRLGLPPVHFDIDYKIDPRGELSETTIRESLETIRQKQRSLSSLIIPNLEAVREREAYREEMLKGNPEALRRFREERQKGEIGMPLAPGEESLRPSPSSADSTASTKSSNAGAAAAGGEADKKQKEVEETAKAMEAEDPTVARQKKRKEEIEARWRKLRNAKALRLRELARLGAQDAKQEGERQLFRSRS